MNFFRHCATFFEYFCLQRVPFQLFLIFCNKLEFPNTQRVCPFYIFWNFETVSKLFSSLNLSFLNLYKILRSRKFFDYLCNRRVFSTDLSMKFSSFSKTVRMISIKFCSHYTPKDAPACARASKSYEWDVRNIAKISSKMTKKQSFLDFFSRGLFFSKTIQTFGGGNLAAKN